MPSNFPHGADARQIISRDVLAQIFPGLSGQQLDLLLRSIDKDLTVPLRADASATPDLVVHIGPALVNNAISGRQKTIPHILNVIPTFSGGTVTFPAADGGTIVVSPGASVNLSCPLGNYVKVLISLDSSGNLVVSVGAYAGSEVGAAIPAPVADTLAACYVSLFNNGGTIQPIAQNKIFQLTGGGGGSGGSPATGFAQEVPVSQDATSITVTFPTTLQGVSYVPQAVLVNYVDGDPQYQDVVVSNKTTTGFTATWNAPADSANYFLAYIVPTVQLQIGEVNVDLGLTSITVTLPISLNGTNYVVLPHLVNYVDGTPQYQTAMPVAKTDTTFTVSWNSPTDSADYKLAFHVAQIQ